MNRDYRIRTRGDQSVNYGSLIKIVKLSEGRWATFTCLSTDRAVGTGYFPSGPIHESLDEARFFLRAKLGSPAVEAA